MIVTDDMPSAFCLLQTHIATDDKDADTKRLQERSALERVLVLMMRMRMMRMRMMMRMLIRTRYVKRLQ